MRKIKLETYLSIIHQCYIWHIKCKDALNIWSKDIHVVAITILKELYPDFINSNFVEIENKNGIFLSPKLQYQHTYILTERLNIILSDIIFYINDNNQLVLYEIQTK